MMMKTYLIFKLYKISIKNSLTSIKIHINNIWVQIVSTKALTSNKYFSISNRYMIIN
jgi:hypothetical protein